MGRNMIDLTGERFGSWTVLGRHNTDYMSRSFDYRSGKFVTHAIPMWDCRCDCGHVEAVIGSNLRSGHSTKCRFCRELARNEGLMRHHRAAHRLRDAHPKEYANV